MRGCRKGSSVKESEQVLALEEGVGEGGVDVGGMR